MKIFAPIVKLNIGRVFFSLTTNLDWTLQQMNVKNTFLNGNLEEEVYINLPLIFDKESKDGKVCKLRKSLYGLKQSPHAWFNRFAKSLHYQGYTQANSDYMLFYKHRNEKVTILRVYMDDIILTSNDKGERERLKEKLALEFKMKDLGSLHIFLEIEVARSREGISISQRKYVLDLLKETSMIGCKPANTPMDPNTKLSTKLAQGPMNKGRYHRLVGKLIYLSHTRLDIAFGISYVSQFMHPPLGEHMEAVHKILRDIKGTFGRSLFFRKTMGNSIEVYTNAD